MTESLKERETQTKQEAATRLPSLRAVEPKRALALSVVPGLGQFYNGERVKGALFLTVAMANVVLLSLLFFTEPMLQAIVSLGSMFHFESKLNIQQTLEIVHTGRAVTLVYLSLILSFYLYVARDAYDRAVEKNRGLVIPRFKLTMPEATSGSYLVHFSTICALLMMVVFVVAPPKLPEETNVTFLLDKPEPPPPPKKEPEPPKPKPEQKKEEPKKVEQPKKAVAPTPPKPTPVAVAVKTDQPVADPVVQSNEPAPAAAPAETAGSANGSPNGTGAPDAGGGGDGDDVDFGNYLDEVKKRIKKNWYPPRGAESLTITLKFKVMSDGSVGGNIKLVKSSGVAAADDAAKLAITNAAPFPALPKGAGPFVDIKFAFDYNVFNGKQ